MADLGTRYLGLRLKSPLIVASSGLTGSVDGARKAALAGAGAVVLKSLFEEQLAAEIAAAGEEIAAGAHPEADAFFARAGMEEGARDYLKLVSETRDLGIPVIASLNCVGAARLSEFARRIQDAGAAALELNLAFLPRSPSETGAVLEARLVEAVTEVRAATSLPLAVKIGPSWASLPALAASLERAGASSLVLFNRFYRLDVDLQKLEMKPGSPRSTGEEYHESLRWISLLSGRLSCDLCASTGVHDAETALKLVAVGAGAVEVCSVIYRRGFGVIGEMNRAMEEWLESRGLASLQAIQGRLSQANSRNPEAHERLQYIKALTGIS